MKKKFLAPFIIFLFVLLLAGGLYVIPRLTPQGAIRAHLFLENPSQSLSCTLKKERYVDPVAGQQYSLDKFQGKFSGVYFAYVKRNLIGLYYWAGGGSGP